MKVNKDSFKNLKLRQLNSRDDAPVKADPAVADAAYVGAPEEAEFMEFQDKLFTVLQSDGREASPAKMKYDPNKTRPASAAKKYNANRDDRERPVSAAREQHFVSSGERPQSAAREQHFVSSGEKPQSAAYEYLLKREDDTPRAEFGKTAVLPAQPDPSAAASASTANTSGVRTSPVTDESLVFKPVIIEGTGSIEAPRKFTSVMTAPPKPAGNGASDPSAPKVPRHTITKAPIQAVKVTKKPSAQAKPAVSSSAKPAASSKSSKTSKSGAAAKSAGTQASDKAPAKKAKGFSLGDLGKSFKSGGEGKASGSEKAGRNSGKGGKRSSGRLHPSLQMILLVELIFIITLVAAMAFDYGKGKGGSTPAPSPDTTNTAAEDDNGNKDNTDTDNTSTDSADNTGDAGDSAAANTSVEEGFSLAAACHDAERSAIGDETTDADSPVVKVAREQLGNYGGDPYWSWYGFSYHVPWCACFVSWVGNETGYLQDGKIPKYAVVDDGEYFYKNKGLWLEPGETPQGGDIVFFDKNQDGYIDHTGIVSGTLGSRVFTIEGNTGFAEHGQDTDQESEEWLGICWRRGYELDDPRLYGYGMVDR